MKKDTQKGSRFRMVDRELVSKGDYGRNPKVVKEALAELAKHPGKYIYVPLTEFATKNRGTIRSAFFRHRADIRTFFEDGCIAVGVKAE